MFNVSEQLPTFCESITFDSVVEFCYLFVVDEYSVSYYHVFQTWLIQPGYNQLREINVPETKQTSQLVKQSLQIFSKSGFLGESGSQFGPYWYQSVNTIVL